MLESQILVAIYAAEEGKLRILRSSGGPGVSPPGKFLEILALLVQNFLMENPYKGGFFGREPEYQGRVPNGRGVWGQSPRTIFGY